MMQINPAYIVMVFIVLVAFAIYRVVKSRKKYFSGNEYLKRICDLQYGGVLYKITKNEKTFVKCLPGQTTRKDVYFLKDSANRILDENREMLQSMCTMNLTLVPVDVNYELFVAIIKYRDSDKRWAYFVRPNEDLELFTNTHTLEGLYIILPKKIPVQ